MRWLRPFADRIESNIERETVLLNALLSNSCSSQTVSIAITLLMFIGMVI